MYRNFVTAYETFCESQVEDPLWETLHLIDLLSDGALRRLDSGHLGSTGVELSHLVQARENGKPLEYALGLATFMGLSFYSSPAALIPRQETELLANTVLAEILEREKAGGPVMVVDVGTGSGNIAVALGAYSRSAQILATDISEDAIALAARNVGKYGLEERIRLFCGDLLQPLVGQGLKNCVDIVVFNPPYIPTQSIGRLDRSITDFEPVVALDAGPYGIDFFRRVVNEALPFLKPGGLLAFEIGAGQDKIARRFVEKAAGYENVRSVSDHAGMVRVIVAHRK